MGMRTVAACLLMSCAIAPAGAQTAPPRPKITGVSHIAVYTTNPAATEHFFTVIIGAAKLPDPECPRGVRYAINPTQFVEVLPLPAGAAIGRLDHTAWNVTSAERMRRYLAAKGWKTPAYVKHGSDGSRWFTVRDPEGNRVQFVQPPTHPKAIDVPHVIGQKIIHVGFVVHSRAKEDTFYRDLLGFRPYWFGGMHDGEIDWVSQQVPDGREWLEYMLVRGPGPGIPVSMSPRQLGVMDHFSIGEVSVPEAYKVLAAGNRLASRHDLAPQIGRDGKYQFNLYDPDGTRVELMNFRATDKPCCSPFTAPDPTPAE